jgi:hypothetical protein
LTSDNSETTDVKRETKNGKGKTRTSKKAKAILFVQWFGGEELEHIAVTQHEDSLPCDFKCLDTNRV